ncbi:MAG: FAD-dependent oxidoreductase [Nitrososphaeria archaeon]
MEPDYEVVVIGAGPSGSAAARAAASKGARVLLIEKDTEVGIPEICGGLVSSSGLEMIGSGFESAVRTRVKFGKVFVGDEGFEFGFDQELIVLNRELFDKLMARRAVEAGSDVELGSYAIYSRKNGVNAVYIKGRKLTAKHVINATGVSGYPLKDEVVRATQTVYAVKENYYEGIAVYINKDIMRRLFAWYIPYGDGMAKIGAVGPLDQSLRIIEKAAALVGVRGRPIKVFSSGIVVGGPYTEANDESYAQIGDAGGQAKPTTGGGIVFGALGGIYAGSLAANGQLKRYNSEFYERGPGKDLYRQLRIREVYEALDNRALSKALRLIRDSGISISGDEFDYHSKLMKRVLGDPRLILRLAEILPSALLSYLRSSLFS